MSSDPLQIRGTRERTSVLFRYPKQLAVVPEVEIDIDDVRAVDTLRVRFDYDRDGWSILQQPGVDRGSWIEREDEWQEVAFVESYGLVREEGDDA